MQEKTIEELREGTQREIIKQTLLRDFYLKRAEGQEKQAAADTKLKASNLDDNITFNTEFLAFLDERTA